MAEEDEEVIILRSCLNRNAISNVFLKREQEDAPNILINKHLIDEEDEFESYFRFTLEQFNWTLNDIKQDLYQIPAIVSTITFF